MAQPNELNDDQPEAGGTNVETPQVDETNTGVADDAETIESASTTEAGEEAQPQGIVVTIGDTPPAEDDPALNNPNFKQLRESYRKKSEENRELKRRLDAVAGVKAEVRAEPTLEGCDYDPEKFKAEMRAYVTEQAQADAKKQAALEAQAKVAATFHQRLAAYAKEKEAFKARAPDFDEAEADIKENLSVMKQNIIVDMAKDIPLVIYALHKNQAKLKELAELPDHKFVWHLAQMETQLKVSNRGERPQAEERVEGVRHAGNTSDLHLARLEKEFERTGDRSKIVAYKKSLKEKKSA